MGQACLDVSTPEVKRDGVPGLLLAGFHFSCRMRRARQRWRQQKQLRRGGMEENKQIRGEALPVA